MTRLDNAVKLAVGGHLGQKDKAGAPYILHSLRVMTKMGTDEERMAAVPHDYIEDTDGDEDELRRQGFSEAVIEAVRCLSRWMITRTMISSSPGSKPTSWPPR